MGSPNRYFDNAALAFPRSEGVEEGMARYLAAGASYGRASHGRALDAARMVEEARGLLSALLGVSRPQRISFALNATVAINTVLRGFPYRAWRVLISPMEHNAVTRTLAGEGVGYDLLPALPSGLIDLGRLAGRDLSGYDLVVVNGASNVNGVVQPLGALRGVLGEAIPLMVDASQVVGHSPLAVEEWGIDFLAFSGHKGLASTTGAGCLYQSGRVALRPLVYGGTGSGRSADDMPEVLPDAFEAGTHNMLGIAALLGALRRPLDRAHGREDFARLLAGLRAMPGLRVYHGHGVEGGRTGHDLPPEPIELLSLVPTGMEVSDLAYRLYAEHGIELRSGLHCASLAHRHLGTYPEGTVRLSLSPAHTAEELAYLLGAVRSVVS